MDFMNISKTWLGQQSKKTKAAVIQEWIQLII